MCVEKANRLKRKNAPSTYLETLRHNVGFNLTFQFYFTLQDRRTLPLHKTRSFKHLKTDL